MFVKGIRTTLRKRYEKHRPVAFFRAVPLLSENRFLARRPRPQHEMYFI